MKNKNKCLIIIWILLLIIIFVFGEQFVENNKWWAYNNIKNYSFSKIDNNIILKKNDIVVLKKIDNDFRTVLSKYFWKIKLDKNLILKDKDSYHLFYFSQKVPKLNSVINLVLPEIKLKWYIQKDIKDSRTYEFNTNINGDKYSVILTVLSYHLDNEEYDVSSEDMENMWIFMLYIKKI